MGAALEGLHITDAVYEDPVFGKGNLLRNLT